MSCDRGKKPWHQQLFWGVDGPRPQNVSCSLNQHPKPEESDYPLISAPTTSVIKLRTSFLFHLGPSKLSYFPKNFPIFQAVSGRYQDSQPHPPTAGPKNQLLNGRQSAHGYAKSRCELLALLSFEIPLVLFFPQIAIAIGGLTSNRGGGRRTTLAHWTWHQGAIAGCSGRGTIAPLQCAMVGRGEGDGQLWGSGHGAIAECNCRVPL